MPTVIDESGDTGHARDSLPFFRLAAVCIPTASDVDAFRAAVRQLRQNLRLDAAFEFKFARTHTHPDRRRAFFQCALQHPFRFSFCGIDKTQGHWKTAPSVEQHWATATAIAACLRSTYHEMERLSHPLREQILVDDNGDQGFLLRIEDAFRALQSRLHPNTPMVRKPRFRGSAPDEVMQLVDMVCGAAGAAIDGDDTWYKMIRERCLGLLCLP